MIRVVQCSTDTERIRSKGVRRPSRPLPSLGLACLVLLTGCGYSGFAVTGGSSPSVQSDNWEFVPVAAAVGGSATPLTLLTGSVNASTTASRVNTVLQATSGCYGAAAPVPLDGSRSGNQVDLRSFGDRGQYLTLSGQLDDAFAHFTGTYKVEGGCGDGDRGSITGTRYNALTGQFVGSAVQGPNAYAVTLNLTQGVATGEGTFQLSGSLNVAGGTCFSQGQFAKTQGYVTGSFFQADLTDSAGVKVHVQGRSIPSVDTLQIQSLTVTGAACTATYGAFPLKRQ